MCVGVGMSVGVGPAICLLEVGGSMWSLSGGRGPGQGRMTYIKRARCCGFSKCSLAATPEATGRAHNSRSRPRSGVCPGGPLLHRHHRLLVAGGGGRRVGERGTRAIQRHLHRERLLPHRRHQRPVVRRTKRGGINPTLGIFLDCVRVSPRPPHVGASYMSVGKRSRIDRRPGFS